MSAEYMHLGIPVTTRRPDMTYEEKGKFWVGYPEDCDYKMEYLKFEEGTIFPELIHRVPHVAYKVDQLEPYMEDADQIICGPLSLSSSARLAFVIKDCALIELYQVLE